MRNHAVVDAGPIVAFFDPADEHHDWARSSFVSLRPPLLTCEAVLAEAMHLLRRDPETQDKLLELIAAGSLRLAFDLPTEVVAVRRLMRKYRNVPMAFADACLVRMAEEFDEHAVLTLDSDFRVYRTEDGAALRVLTPDPA